MKSSNRIEFINMAYREKILSIGSSIQEGIYYSPGQQPRNSFCLICLRAANRSDSGTIKQTLFEIWKMYQDLRKNIKSEPNWIGKDPQDGMFSILFGYGPRFFEFRGLTKPKPEYLADRWRFSEPRPRTSPILPDVGLNYAEDVHNNEVTDDHVVIQLIGNTEFGINRAVVETWKALRKIQEGNEDAGQ